MDRKKINQWDGLLLEERNVENALDEAIETQRKMDKLEDKYSELFYRVNHLVSRLDQFIGNDQEKQMTEELRWQVQQKKKAVFFHLEEEKEKFLKETKELQDQEDLIYYQKKRLLIEEKV
ncbi:DUF3958 family protein [Enterococcus sp. LJL128]